MLLLVSVDIIGRTHIYDFYFVLDFDPKHEDRIAGASALVIFRGLHVFRNFYLVELDHKWAELGVEGEVIMKEIVHVLIPVDVLSGRGDIYNILPPVRVKDIVRPSLVLRF